MRKSEIKLWGSYAISGQFAGNDTWLRGADARMTVTDLSTPPFGGAATCRGRIEEISGPHTGLPVCENGVGARRNVAVGDVVTVECKRIVREAAALADIADAYQARIDGDAALAADLQSRAGEYAHYGNVEVTHNEPHPCQVSMTGETFQQILDHVAALEAQVGHTAA